MVEASRGGVLAPVPPMGDHSLESTLFFETPEELYARVFRWLKPRTPVPGIRVEFCPFANANSFIRLENGELHVRICDVLIDAPAPVMEALAVILLSKLYRKTIARTYTHRYRLYLNRRDVRHQLTQIRRERGRKHLSGAAGDVYNLDELFEDLNSRFFGGMMSRPELSWSRTASRTTLGHYDPVHHAIVISRLLDRPGIPKEVIDYVMFHEMLHLRHPVEHNGARRRVHTREFKEAERQFPDLAKVRQLLKRL